MKKLCKLLPIVLLICLALAVGAFASAEPSGEPSAEPCVQASGEPSSEPDAEASGEPSSEPDAEASGEPSSEPDAEAFGEPSDEPSDKASAEPVAAEGPALVASTLAVQEPEIVVTETVITAEGKDYTVPVYVIDGVEYVKLDDLKLIAVYGDKQEPVEPAIEEIDVTVRVNEEEHAVAAVGVTVEGNTYSFHIAELLDTMGIILTYDESANVASLTAREGSVFAAVIADRMAAEPAASGKPAPVEGPAADVSASEEPAVEGGASEESLVLDIAAEKTAEEEAIPVTDGTENQKNTLESSAQPATEAEHEAYEAYLVEYMNAYTGVGDGTFDDSARLMAIGELDGVSFGSDVNAFPFEMFVTQFGALDYAAFADG